MSDIFVTVEELATSVTVNDTVTDVTIATEGTVGPSGEPGPQGAVGPAGTGEAIDTGLFAPIIHNHDDDYYPLDSNPSGYLTGIETGQFASDADLLNYVLKSDTGDFVLHSETGHDHSSLYYPLNSNPSGYLTGVDLSSYVKNSDTGQFVSDFDLLSYVLKSETGHNHDSEYYPLDNNPSGYLITNEVEEFELVGTGGIVIITGLETGKIYISGEEIDTGMFSPLVHDHDSLYYPLNENPAEYITSGDLPDTGLFAPLDHGHDESYYPLDSNPSGYLTGVDLSEYIKFSQTGEFASDNDLLDYVLKSESGHNHDSQYYPLTSNPSSYMSSSGVTAEYLSKFSSSTLITKSKIYESGNRTHVTGQLTINAVPDASAYLALGSSGILFDNGSYGPVLQYHAARAGMLQFTRKDIQTLGRNYILLGYDGTNSAIQFTSQGLVGWSASTTSAHPSDTSLTRLHSGAINVSSNLLATGLTGYSVSAVNSFRINNSLPPATSTSTGISGQFAWDADYFYVCTNTNVWKRAALTTW